MLAGGAGTRLRPLTSSIPKPVIPFVDRPFIAFMLDWLRRHGVEDVVLGCGYMAAAVREVLGDGRELGVRLIYVEEREPLGTAGAIKHAAAHLGERFLVLNGDILSDLDLTAQMALHAETGAQATIALVPVTDPSAYGLVRRAEDGTVTAFLEKPAPEEIDTDLVNAGAYVLEASVLDLVPDSGPCSIEREVFPRLIGHGLHGFRAEGYWLDIGTPERYLQGTADILSGAVATPVRAGADPGARVEGELVAPVLVAARAEVAAGAQVGPATVIAAGAWVGAGARVTGTAVLAGAHVGEGAEVRGAIVGPGAVIGDRARVEDGAILGAGARVAPGAHVGPRETVEEGAGA